jgi:large subunit ribosomal protein L28
VLWVDWWRIVQYDVGRTGRVCDLTGKKANNGYKVSFSKHRTKSLQGANLQYKRLWWEEGKRFVKLRVCTKALKTVEKKGLQAMAKEAGINLADF